MCRIIFKDWLSFHRQTYSPLALYELYQILQEILKLLMLYFKTLYRLLTI